MIDEKALSDIISENVNLRLVEPHIYSVYPEGEHTNMYERIAPVYDMLVSNDLYSRIMWGFPIRGFTTFCQEQLASSNEGWVLDIGCGSLIFSAGLYANYTERPVVLCDLSVRMLRRAKSRLMKLKGYIPDNLVFLHADALELPFNPRSFKTVIAMNILHHLEDPRPMLCELEKERTGDGTISFSTLVLNKRRIGDLYLRLMGRSGEVVARTPEQLMTVFDKLGFSARHYLRGNLMFIH
jgi:SAM-dependent methyltransferase